MDAELLGIAMGWEISGTVATDSQAAIDRISQLQFLPPMGWVEERLVEAQLMGERRIVKVKAHPGVMGNELADYKAKEAATIGKAMGWQEMATPAGIRHANRISWKTKWTAASSERFNLHLYR